jgi:Flp pilus assembly protein TadD
MRLAPVLALLLTLPLAAHATSPVAKPKAPLDALFASLAKTQSEDDAKPIENAILSLFEQSGSPSVDLLMTRSEAAMAAGDKATARQLIDSITNIAPDFAEAWHRRAALQADAGDDEGALISLQRTVTLNPREFEAYSDMGGILSDYGDKKAALAAYRKALALDPHLEGLDKRIEAIAREAEGEKI